jgi:hypothetical protein
MQKQSFKNMRLGQKWKIVRFSPIPGPPIHLLFVDVVGKGLFENRPLIARWIKFTTNILCKAKMSRSRPNSGQK